MPSHLSDETPLVVAGTADKPRLPDSRIKNGWHAHGIYRTLEWADSDSERNRARIDHQIDGGLPYSPDVLADAGRGEDANVNFGEAKAEDDLAKTPFVEMGTVSPILWRIKSRYGKPSEQRANSAKISQGFSRTVRAWGRDFNYYLQKTAQEFTRHGAAFAYFEDELDWHWRSDGLSAFKVPRGTESRASAISYCVCKREMTTDELWRKIRKEKVVKEVGRWNVEAVKMAIFRAASTPGATFDNYQWEEIEKQFKENDIDMGSRCDRVNIYHLWVREYDGTIAHYIGLQDGVFLTAGTLLDPTKDNKDQKSDMVGNGFLYAHRCRFPSFESCIVPFFYAIGTHGTIHTIRGQGEMNYGPTSIANRTRNMLIDAVKAASLVIVQTETATEAESLAYVQMGGFMVLPANVKLNATAMPDTSARVQPLLDEMVRLRQQLLPRSTAQATPNKSKQPQTKYAIQAQQNTGGALGSAVLTQWFDPWGDLGREMYRRMMNPDLTEENPGGKEAFEFRAYCMKLGVPPEAMAFDQCEVESMRVIGNGSPEQRQYTAEQVWELADAFDEPGRKKALLDVVSATGVDYQSAEDYVGPEEPRQPVDDQIARMENSLFTVGAPAQVTGEQDHWVHCQDHEELVKQFVASFQQGEIDGQKLVTVLKPALDNMLAHSEFLTKDKSREKESAQVRKFIQNNNGVLEQQENKLIATQQKAMQQPGGNGQQPTGEEQRAWELHQAKIRQLQMEAEMRQREMQQKLQIQQAEAHARMTIADLKASRDMAERAAQLASEAA